MMKNFINYFNRLTFLGLIFLMSYSSTQANIDTVYVGPNNTFTFSPSNFTTGVGDTVLWLWSSGSHTTTSSSIPTGASSWNSPMTSTSTSFMYVPTVTGTYNYVCTPHASFMTASFNVCAHTSSTQTVRACNSYTMNNQTYNSTGTYTQTIPNAAGCDSVITLNLTIDQVDTTVNVSGNTLTAVANQDTYHWVNCDSAFTGNPADTNQSFTPVSSGNYAVIVSNGVCRDTSSCHRVTVTGLRDMNKPKSLSIAPNPVLDVLNISDFPKAEDMQLKIYNLAGKIVREVQTDHASAEIDVSELSGGVYFIEIQTAAERYQAKFIKQ